MARIVISFEADDVALDPEHPSGVTELFDTEVNDFVLHWGTDPVVKVE